MLDWDRADYIVEAAQVDPAHVHSGDAKDGVLKRLELKTQAGLSSIWRLMVFHKAHDHCFQRTRRVVGSGLARMEQRVQSTGIGEGIRSKGREPGICV